MDNGHVIKLSAIPLNALVVFEVVARYASMSQAGRHMHVTPGAVSRQMTRLEELIGVELFLRRGRGLELSVAGQTLLPYIREAVSLATIGLQKAVDSSLYCAAEELPLHGSEARPDACEGRRGLPGTLTIGGLDKGLVDHAALR